MEEKNYDINDESELKAHCAESEKIADQYKDACLDFAESGIVLGKKYLKAVKEGKIKDSTAIEKAHIIITDGDAEAQADYEVHIKSELLMKGLEKVLEARAQSRMIHQSLMKNRAAQGAS